MQTMTFQQLNTRALAFGNAIKALTECQKTISYLGYFPSSLQQTLQDLTEEQAVVSAELSARSSTVSKYQSTLIRRLLNELGKEKSAIEHKIKMGRILAEEKQAVLRKAGIGESDVCSVAPAYDDSQDRAELEKLNAESAAWGKFQRFGLVEYLPAGYELPE